MKGSTRNALSVDRFCREHSIGRTLLYRLLREGRGPRIMKVGRRTLISVEAAEEWRKQMEQHCGSRPGVAAAAASGPSHKDGPPQGGALVRCASWSLQAAVAFHQKVGQHSPKLMDETPRRMVSQIYARRMGAC